MSADNLIRLQRIFRDVFDRPDMVLTPELTADQVDGWDSFMQITLILAAEEEFGIKFALTDIEKLRNVGQMVELIDQKAGSS